MKVLFPTSEVAPLIKTGGLADVSGALPAALRAIGVDVRVLVPGYSQVMARLGQFEVAATFSGLAGFPASRLLSSSALGDVPLWVLDCPDLYQRDGGAYQNPAGRDWADNALRFGLLSKVAAVLGSAASPLDWRPDLVHCNDWQTALAPAYLHFAQDAAPSIISIHNLAFQGIFPPETVQLLGLQPSCFSIDGVEYYGNLSFLKAGLFYAAHITTVSPNYAREIQQEELGFGLQGLLSLRRDTLTGILNGIDIEEWNPASDRHLASSYSAANMDGKTVNKKALQKEMGLSPDSDMPLLGVVSRFTHQKGIDLLLEVAPRLLKLPAQLVMLGTGDEQIEKSAHNLAHRHPGKIGLMVGFSEELSHRIEAGADMFLMPSHFEPCGLNQLYSQRYGTPPIVHGTGGLVDSVVDCTAATLKNGTASGFVFRGMTAENLLNTTKRAIGFYRDKSGWNELRRICMAKRFDWQSSAQAYRDVYLKVLGGTRS